MKKHSTAIEDLPDNNAAQDRILQDLKSIKEDISETGSDTTTSDNNDVEKFKDFIGGKNSSFTNKILKYSIDTVIVFILYVVFSNKYLNRQFFDFQFLTPYYGTIIGNSIVGLMVAIMYFLIRFFKDT